MPGGTRRSPSRRRHRGRSGPASVLEHYKIQRESEAAFHIATMAVDQDRNSSVTCHSMSFGGSPRENYVHTLFRGEGGSVGLNGLFMPSGTQQSDTTHESTTRPCLTSLELYRGILGGKARGVFNGTSMSARTPRRPSPGR